MNLPEYVLIYDNRQGSEYVSYNTWCEVTTQVNEYLLRDRRIHNLVKDLRRSTLVKSWLTSDARTQIKEIQYEDIRKGIKLLYVKVNCEKTRKTWKTHCVNFFANLKVVLKLNKKAVLLMKFTALTVKQCTLVNPNNLMDIWDLSRTVTWKWIKFLNTSGKKITDSTEIKRKLQIWKRGWFPERLNKH